jgi:hypothetical protein
MVYVLTCLFVFCSSLYLVIKLGLILFIGLQLKIYAIYQKPHPEIQDLSCCQNQWKLKMSDGQEHIYTDVDILIHNILFQLLRLSSPNKNKVLILFNDQLSSNQLRLLHLKTTKF